MINQISVAERIGKIVEGRRSRLPAIENDLRTWAEADRLIEELGTVKEALLEKKALPAELRAVLGGLETAPMRQQVAQALEQLRIAQARFSRETINIGVTGRARVGKSTFLQAISGLDDTQVPTGSGLPVTAVRSRIFHSDSPRAILTFHTEVSFMQQVIAPYFAATGLHGRPDTLAEFRGWREFEDPPDSPHSVTTLITRLREIQGAIDSYAGELDGGQREIPLEQLRGYVAYPTLAEQRELAERAPRRYLAVRDVRIETPFPRAAVDRLGIIDLPGLGEVAARAEEHHVEGLRDNVDVVVLIKRPVEGLAYWGEDDAATVDLMDHARGYVQSRRDFLTILVNRSPDDDPGLVESLTEHIRSQVNQGQAAKHFMTLEADARDQHDVGDRALWPVLEHLAARLPAMDGDVLSGVRAGTTTIARNLGRDLEDLQAQLGDLRLSLGSAAEDLEFRAGELRKDLAAALTALTTELRATAEHHAEDLDYIAAVNAAHEEVKSWIAGGLGVGEDQWLANALRTMRVDRNTAPFASNELNRIRIHVSRRYAQVDDALKVRVEELQRSVADVLEAHLGGLIADAGEPSGADALCAFEEALSYAPEPCPALSGAINALATLRLEYRTHVHPRIRGELNQLNLQVQHPETGELFDQLVVEITEAGAAELYRQVVELAEMAIYRVRRALVRESAFPALVLYAVAEQFEDEVIRSGDSPREFGRLARSYRDELWPGVYSGLESQNAHVARFRNALVAAKGVLDSYGLAE